METPPPLPPRTPPLRPPSSQPDSFVSQAALMSLLAPLAGFALNIFGQGVVATQPPEYQFMVRMIFAGIGAFFILIGLTLGIIALCNAKNQSGIFGRALTGTIINVALIILCVALIPAVKKAKARAEATRKSLANVQESSRQLQQETAKSLKKGSTVRPEEMTEKLDQLQKSLQEASTNASGNDALMMKASSAYLEKFNTLKRDYDAAVTDLKQAKILSAPSGKDQSELDSRRAIVEKFLAANDKVKTFIAHGEQHFRDEFQVYQVPPRVTEAAVAGYRKKADVINPLVVSIRETDNRIGNGMLGIIDLEKTNWGGWSVSGGKILFDETSVLHDYNGFLKEIRDASTDQEKLQQKFLQVSKGL